MGSVEVRADVALTAGQPHEIEVEYRTETRQWAFGAKIGCVAVSPPDLMDRAVAAAAWADTAIVVVGTNNDWESESFDRQSIDLPGDQEELISRIGAVNSRTVVAVNAGSPVAMDWSGVVPAVMQIWFGGQGMGLALAGVLMGDREPSGRLPTTFPVRIEDNPSYGNFPGEHGRVRYGEGVLVGYRGYEAKRFALYVRVSTEQQLEGRAYHSNASQQDFLIGWVARKVWRMREDLLRSRGRVHKLSFFIHDFMHACELEQERVDACSFMVATPQGPLSMCLHNAKRDTYLLSPIAVGAGERVRFWDPVSGRTQALPPSPGQVRLTRKTARGLARVRLDTGA